MILFFNTDLCQENEEGGNLTSTDHGGCRIRDAADLHQHIVFCRLHITAKEGKMTFTNFT